MSVKFALEYNEFKMTALDEIKARIDIVDLVSETVQLRRSGKNYTGFCPFHPNSRTPAFVVFPESGTWRCFGQCNEGGDIFKFVMKKEGWDFPEAMRNLAEKAGVQLKLPTPEEQAATEEHDHLRNILEEAIVYYRHQLLNTPAGKFALEYLRDKRKLNDEIIETFGLGYAPNSWDETLKYFLSKGHRQQDLIDSGLVSQRQENAFLDADTHRSGVYDRFRHRIMFPIRDERGRMAGFGARVLNPDDIPKFLNSPQTPIFDKGHLLYGLDRARKTIRTQDQAVIVEGYLDVIALHQAGFTNAVSPMGTALTEHHLYLLKRFSRRIILALDPDAAGDKATLRGLQVARQAMDREQEPVFDARGLLGYEARLQADIRVTTLPAGLDPDELVSRDAQEWERLVLQARPVVIHVMETLAVGRDLEDAKVKSDIASQVLPLIQEIPNSIERDTYRQRLARFLRLDERTLLETGPSPSRPRHAARRTTTQLTVAAPSETLTPALDSNFNLEAHCLGVLLRQPELLYQVDRALQKEKLQRLTAEDFQHGGHQSIFRLLNESIGQDLVEPLNYILNSLSLPLMELADDLLARTAHLDPNQERVLEDLMRGLLSLRQRRLRQEIEYLHFTMQEAQQAGDVKASTYSQTMAELTQSQQRLHRALAKFTGQTNLH
jgi:DNA primase